MLTDAQVERYSRQILLPEIGARGQMRLLGARVTLGPGGEAAVVAATLLGRAGVGALDLIGAPIALPELSPDCRVGAYATADEAPAGDVYLALADTADLGRAALAAGRPCVAGRVAGPLLTVATLTGRPCAGCFSVAAAGTHLTAAWDPTALTLGALAAHEALRTLLERPARGRITTLDLTSGRLTTGDPEPARGCARCAATS